MQRDDLSIDAEHRSTTITDVEDAAARFESAWAQGQRPQIDDYLPAHGASRQAVLLELVHADLEFRLKAGEEARVEHYLERFPALRQDGGALLELIVREYKLRCRRPRSVTVDEYLHRFPDIGDRLLDQLSPAPNKAPVQLRLNCPHCRNPIELVDDGSHELVCPACGSTFRLDNTGTQTWSPQRLPQLGRFQLLEPVGRGSFGTVYRARDTQLDRIVAVKVPRSGRLVSAEDQNRFVREARNAARLQHPGIVSVYEVGESETFPYIVSEFVDGVTLADFLTSRRMTFREAADTLWQAAVALEHAHGQGVIHRDLKPSNLLLQTTGPDGEHRSSVDSSSGSSSSTRGSGARHETPWRVRVMDFGLARRDEGEPTVTMEGQVLGTPAYMSPEQARGDNKQVDRRSDVYSLGVILYELLTGELPFRGNQRMLLHQVLYDEPRPPRQLNDRIPRDLDTIVLRAMSKEPARRYASAVDLADDLRRWLCGEPIVSRPISRLERGWRWCRRNPAASLAAGTVVAAVIAVVAILSVSVVRIAASAEAQRLAREDAQREARAKEQQRLLAVSHQQRAETERQAAIAAGQREAQQRQAAEESAEQARAATAFLVSVFESADPLGLHTLGFRQAQETQESLSAREILDRGRQRVEKELASQPLVQASLFDALGTAYLGLGEIEAAGPLLERAREIREAKLPPDHPDVLASLHSRALLKMVRSEMTEAEVLLRRVLAEQEKSGSCPPLTLARTQFHLGLVMNETYRPIEAERLFRDSLAIRDRELGPEHQDTVMTRVMVVATLLGQNRESELGLEEGLKLVQAANAQTGQAFSTLLVKYWQLNRMRNKGDLDAAVEASQALRQDAAELLGANHPIPIALEFDFAGLLQWQGNYREAEAVGRAALAMTPRVLANNPRIAEPHFKLAQLLAARGELGEAEQHLRAAMRIGGRVQVKENLWGLKAAIELARCKQRQGELAAAEQLLRDVLLQAGPDPTSLPLARDALQATHDDAQGTLVWVLLEHNRPREALELARPLYESRWGQRRHSAAPALHMSQMLLECLRDLGAYAEARQVQADRRAFLSELVPNVQSGFGGGESLLLASLLVEQGDIAAAERLARLGLEEARQRCRPGHPDLASFLYSAGELLRDCNCAGEGRLLLEETLQIRLNALGPKHRDTINTQLALAKTLSKLGEQAGALEASRLAYQAAAEAYGADNLETCPAAQLLAEMLAASGQFEEAETLLRKRLEIAGNRYPAGHRQIWQASLDLGDLLWQKEDSAAGNRLFHAMPAQFSAVLPANSWRLAEITSRIGAAESASGDYQAAAPKLLQSLKTLEEAWGPRHPRVQEALKRVIRHYEASGDREAQDRFREKL